MPTPEPQRDGTRLLGWPLERLDEALETLARRSRLVVAAPADSGDDPAAGASDSSPGVEPPEFAARIEAVAVRLGLEVEETEVPYTQVENLLLGCGPALLKLPSATSGHPTDLLVVLGRRGRKVRLLGPDLVERRVGVKEAAGWLCRAAEKPVLPGVERLLRRLHVAPRRVARARGALLKERLRQTRLGGCWLLRLPPGSDFWRQLRHDGLHRQLATYLVMYVLSFGLFLLSWWTLGRGALEGHLSRDWLLAWSLILLSLVLPRLISTWSQAKLAAGAGTLLKRRLLQGALRLDVDEIRHQGAGQLLGRVIESQAVQTHALVGGFLAIVGVLELAMSAWVLAQGVAGWFHVALLVLWLLAVLLAGWRYLVLRRAWTEERLEMTHDLVENMIGHRTRLAQERQASWHARDDRRLESYLGSSQRMDSKRTLLIVAPFAWVLVGICGLLPAFVTGRGSVPAMALAVAGVLLAFRGFNKLSRGVSHVTSAWISWRQAEPIFRAASRTEDGAGWSASPAPASPDSESEEAPDLIEARDLVYQYRQRARPVLDGCSLKIRVGDRILIEGPSGGGKSTLAAILTRLRRPSSGLLLLRGLDRFTLSEDQWRRHVVSAPQFHENHVFTETFAFNLLMGRQWPPSRQDMLDAREVCQELGLGELLERMPGGLMQMVGETGWQLSHGERSRLFIARALLQDTEAVILDESFAALDPENLQKALRCALKRARTLLVIAHP